MLTQLPVISEPNAHDTFMIENCDSDDGEEPFDEISPWGHTDWWSPKFTSIQETEFTELWYGNGLHHLYDNTYHTHAANLRNNLPFIT